MALVNFFNKKGTCFCDGCSLFKQNQQERSLFKKAKMAHIKKKKKNNTNGHLKKCTNGPR